VGARIPPPGAEQHSDERASNLVARRVRRERTHRRTNNAHVMDLEITQFLAAVATVYE